MLLLCCYIHGLTMNMTLCLKGEKIDQKFLGEVF